MLPYIVYQFQPGQRTGIRIIEHHTGDGQRTDFFGQDISPEQAGKIAPLLTLALLVCPFEIQGVIARPDDARGLNWTIYDQDGGELRQVKTPGEALRLMVTDSQRGKWRAPDLSIEYPCLYE